MERLIRENFMSEWEIRNKLNHFCNVIKKEKAVYCIQDVNDEAIDTIFNAIKESIEARFICIRSD